MDSQQYSLIDKLVTIQLVLTFLAAAVVSSSHYICQLLRSVGNIGFEKSFSEFIILIALCKNLAVRTLVRLLKSVKNKIPLQTEYVEIYILHSKRETNKIFTFVVDV